MANKYIIDYKIYNLQTEYKKISNYLHLLIEHINKLYDNMIITNNCKNQSFEKINSIVKQLNSTFNEIMITIYDSDDDNTYGQSLNNILDETLDFELFSELKILSYKIKKSNIKIHNNMLYNNIFDSHFDNIISEIINLCSETGFPSVNMALLLLNNNEFDNETNKLIKIYNDVYTIFAYTNSNIIHSNDDVIFFKKLNTKKDGLINNCYSMYIKKHDKTYIELQGYFKYDNLNIITSTAQICNDVLYSKIKKIETVLNETPNFIHSAFKKAYIKNITIKDLLTLTVTEYVSLVKHEYKKYKYFTKCSFIDLTKEFIKDDIDNMLLIIKLLLLGSPENINVAGLLFGLTKDKKVGNDIVANIIYKNLSYNNQLKLKKVNVIIKNELERIKTLTIDDIDLKKQIIIQQSMPDHIKSLALDKIEEMKSANNEFYKQQLFVKTLCKFPWSSANDNKLFEELQNNNEKSKLYLNNFTQKINNYIYGHESAKKELKQLICKWISNPNGSGSAIGLYGPPGVGKTLFAKGISDALNIPFAQISLGGQNDGELLYGHGYTYQGAQPGIVVKKMTEMGSARCVLYFDELDKTTTKHGHTNEITSILIHMTDPNMNSEFQDRFFQGINFPLDKVLMVFSYNDPKLVDKILLDRLNKILIEAYTTLDKIQIVKNFIIKEMNNMICLKINVQIEDDIIEYIIENYTQEAGVRELKRCFEKIFLQLNIDKIYGHNIFENNNLDCINIDKEMIIRYLNKSQTNIEKIHAQPLVGVINGMYATSNGSGGIVPIQIYGKGLGRETEQNDMLKLTGSQKDVMKESVMVALTTAINQINEHNRINLLKEFPYGFHVHTPDGATPKDGPSAGTAFTVAFVSRILNKKIKNNISITGEIDLTGKVTKIGGLLYKLIGSKKAGINHVYCSNENKDDYDKIIEKNPKLIDDTFTITFVNHVQEIIKEVIIDIKMEDLELI